MRPMACHLLEGWLVCLIIPIFFFLVVGLLHASLVCIIAGLGGSLALLLWFLGLLITQKLGLQLLRSTV